MSAKNKQKAELVLEVAQLQKRIKELTSNDPEHSNKETGTKWRELAESSPDHILILAPDLTIQYVNHPAPGLTNDELIGNQITSFLDEEQSVIIKEILLGVINTGQSAIYDTEYQIPGQDGGTIYYETHAIPRESDGNVIGLTLSSRDITNRKRAEEALKSSSREWKTTFDAVSDAICLLDSEHHIIRTNRAMQEMYPGQAGKMIGKYCYEVVHGSQELIEGCPVLRMRQTLKRETMKLPQGDRFLEVTVDPILDKSGILISAVHSIRDITERVETDQKLKTATKIINNSPAVVISWKNDEGWPVDFVSENVEKLSGYSTSDFIEGSMKYGDLIHEVDLPRVAAEIDEAAKNKSQRILSHAPYRIIAKNGVVKWIRDKTTISRGDKGKIRKFEGILYDITGEMKISEDLRLRGQELNSLLIASRAINSSLDLPAVLQTIIDSAADLMQIDSAAIYLLEGEELFLGATTPPLDPEMPGSLRRAILTNHPHIRDAVNSRQPVVLADTQTAALTEAERAISVARGLRTIVYLPVFVNELVFGVLILGTIGKPRQYSVADLNLCLTMTNQIAVSLQNSILHKESMKYSSELEEQIRERKQTEQEKDLLLLQVQEANNRLKTLSRELITSQEAERKRISQELHDEFGQALTAISLDLGIIERELSPECPVDTKKRVADLRTMADELDQMIGELALDLRPSLLDDLGLFPTANWYVERFSQRAEIEVEIELIGKEKRLPSEIETALYRIIQEALTNVAKHASAGKVVLRLEWQPKTIIIRIEDDGKGFDINELQNAKIPYQGLGLIGMGDRTALLGGQLDIQSTPGKGTAIVVEIPIAES